MYRESVDFELFVISIHQKINKRNNPKKSPPSLLDDLPFTF